MGGKLFIIMMDGRENTLARIAGLRRRD